MPIEIVNKILSYFQTEKYINLESESSDIIKNNIIKKQKEKLIFFHGVNTDKNSIINFLMICKKFYNLRKSNFVLAQFVVSLNTKKNFNDYDYLVHIDYCKKLNCCNICHYIKKNIKYKNIYKKITNYK